MKDQYTNLLAGLINIGIIGLLFLIPLIFIPIPQNINDARVFAEFNKQIIFVVGSFLLFSFWSLKMVLEKKVTIIRTPLDIPLILFVLVSIISTVFSIDVFVSIAGFYSIFHPSVLSLLALVLFYFTLVSNINQKTRAYALIAFLSSAVLISLVNITNYFGWFVVPYEVAKAREWIPLLSLGTLGFMSSLSIPLALGLALQTKEAWIKILASLFALILFGSLLVVNTFGAWVSLVAALAIILVFGIKIVNNRESRIYLSVVGLLAVAMLAIAFIAPLRDSVVKPLISTDNIDFNLTSERRLPLNTSWQIASGAVSQRPFLGYGPATFPYAYTQHAPASINQTNDWNVRFEQASNEYVNILTTLGIIGFISFISILFFITKPLTIFVSKSETLQENPILLFFLASLGGYIVGSLFFDTSLLVGLLFVLISASTFSTLNSLGAKGVDKVNLKLVSLNAGAIKSFGDSDNPSSNILGYVLLIPAVIISAGTIYGSYLAYKAEVSYQKSIIAARENKASETRDNLLSAVRTFGFRDSYHRTLSLIDIRIAQSISTQQEQSEQNSQNIQFLVQESITEGRIASGYQNSTVIGTSRANVVNWETLASIYANLIGVLDGTENHAIQTYIGAIGRQPNNPLLRQALGEVYLRANQTDEATRILESAVLLKPDLASAHYSLAQAYKQADRDEDAAAELQRALDLLDSEADQDRERIQEELDEISKSLKKSPNATPSANQNQ